MRSRELSTQTHPIVLGTAGHIDHGKTALVRALTGIDTDRLKEEKERGITTELGFAHLDLEGRRFGLVDVPGHERFVKAMVAGAGGIDLVCLVVAADEGIMPQTREHLDICELLGVRRGVVALSKVDLVDDEWLELVTEDVREGLQDSFLGDARIVPVSAKTGSGLDELRAELLRLTANLPSRPATGAFRLPLDRVFTIRGFGTVVTGTILSGTVHAGDTVIAHPSELTGKVRGLEVHGSAAEEARAGTRCAVNLSGLSREDLARGQMLAHPDTLVPSHILDARFHYLDTSKAPLSHRNRVLLHHGTAQLGATLVVVDALREEASGRPDELYPGERALVQLRLDANTPLAALPGDRFIVRGFVMQEHYGTTLGGGEILRVHAPKTRRSSTEAKQALHRIARASGDDRVALEIAGASVAAISFRALLGRLDLARHELGNTLDRLLESGDAIKAPSDAATTDNATLFCHAKVLAGLEQTALEHLDTFHENQPHKEGMSREELRARMPNALPLRVFEQVLEALIRRGAVAAERDIVRRTRGKAARPDAALSALEGEIAKRFAGWGLTPPRPREIPGELGKDPGQVAAALDRLLAQGTLNKVKPDYYVDATALSALRDNLCTHLDEHEQITPKEWKELTGATRKYSIPLAEYFDAEKVTLRIGDVRKRRK